VGAIIVSAVSNKCSNESRGPDDRFLSPRTDTTLRQPPVTSCRSIPSSARRSVPHNPCHTVTPRLPGNPPVTNTRPSSR
jgi:hypothetical protein